MQTLSVTVVAVLLVGINALSQEFITKISEEIQEIGMKCAEKEAATADEIQELMEHKIPPTGHGAKCVLACFYEHYDIMTPDGKFDKQATIKSFDRLKDDDAEIYQKILKVIDICHSNPEITNDRCETASAMATCAKKEANALGITKETLLGA